MDYQEGIMDTIARNVTTTVNRVTAAMALATALILAAHVTAGAQSPEGDPAAFIQSLNDETISVIVSPETSAGQRRDRFGSLLVGNFDLDAIARYAMGRYWQTATPSQQREYLELFRAGVLETYISRFESIREDAARDGGTLTGRIVEVRSVTASDKLVRTLVQMPKGKPFPIAYRLRVRDGQWKIIDVIENGISLLVTRRSEVATTADRKGVDGLLAMMRK